jgi:hypothetical protein
MPFHKQTMLSLESTGDRKSITMELGISAVLLTATTAVMVIALAGPITAFLYAKEYAELVHYLTAFAAFGVVQMTADVLLVRLVAGNANRTLLGACLAAIAAAIVGMEIAPLRWVPELSAAAFIAVTLAICRQYVRGKELLLRTAMIGAGACLSAVYLGESLGNAVGATGGLLIMATGLLVDRSIHTALGHVRRFIFESRD